MKTNLISLFTLLLISVFNVPLLFSQSYDYDRVSQSGVTVSAENSDISYNLDLRAVANVFADSKNLQEFEERINDYDSGINNLDLNNDGQVDYLRVIETAKGNTHLVVLQAVLGPDVYQDVASIVVERKHSNRYSVQIIGDPYIYGPYYILDPVYTYTPFMFSFFWSSYYFSWHSPYYWGYYPSHWHFWHPYPVNVYVHNINIYNDRHNSKFYYSDRVKNNYYSELRHGISRNDYQKANPDRAFIYRNASRENVVNRKDLEHSQFSRNMNTGDSRQANSYNGRGTNSTRMNYNNGDRNSSYNPRTSVNRNENNAGSNYRTTGSRRENYNPNQNYNNQFRVNSSDRGTNSSRNNTYKNNVQRGNNSYSNPSQGRSSNNESVKRNYSRPSVSTRDNSNGSSYSVPSNSSRSYSQPSRSSSSSNSRSSESYSAPSRSNNSYSTPSRSNDSYSAPSRSSSESRGRDSRR